MRHLGHLKSQIGKHLGGVRFVAVMFRESRRHDFADGGLRLWRFQKCRDIRLLLVSHEQIPSRFTSRSQCKAYATVKFLLAYFAAQSSRTMVTSAEAIVPAVKSPPGVVLTPALTVCGENNRRR